jgi:7-carboxy-7-deazaguanine synthase
MSATKDTSDTLQISEIFASIQGESHWAGYPCVFVRLAGCNLDCAYCDTLYAKTGGEAMTLDEVVAKAASFGLKTVELTGGEPLHQPLALELVKRLADRDFRVLIETNGSYPIDRVDQRATVILDLKTPGSKMESMNHWPNLAALKPTDEVKAVVTDRADYLWVVEVIERHSLVGATRITLSPALGQVEPAELAQWMVEDKLDARMQLQLHKLIWPDQDRGV